MTTEPTEEEHFTVNIVWKDMTSTLDNVTGFSFVDSAIYVFMFANGDRTIIPIDGVRRIDIEPEVTL